MEQNNVTELISRGESFTVEFKGEERQPYSDRDLVQTVVCLANGAGGTLLVGVEDDGRITGARPRSGSSLLDPLQVEALIASRTRPVLSCRVRVETIEEKPVLVVDVSESRIPVGTADGVYLRRAILGRGEPGCLPFHFYEMQARLAAMGQLDPSTLVVPGATWHDLDPLEFARLRRYIDEGRGLSDRSLLELPDMEIAKALGVVEANHEVKAVRIAGLLLFGREQALARFIPAHEVAFQVFRGTQVEVNQFYRWPLLRLFEDLLIRFNAHNRETEVMVGMQRVAVPTYPERAFREAVANALIHRDYTSRHAVYIQWHTDYLMVANPGGFPEGVTLGNILVTAPKPRHPLLADAFKRIGLVERTGRGIDTIYYEQLRNGRPAPSYGQSTVTDVVLTLPGGKADLEFVRLIVEANQAGKPLQLDDLLLLNHLQARLRITVAEAAILLQKPPATATAALLRLVERGWLEESATQTDRFHRLTADIGRKLGKDPAGF